MPDCVIDASVLALSNGDLAGRRAGNVLDKRLCVIESVVEGRFSLRYNYKLLVEYTQIVHEHRNDAIALFFELLDSNRATLVKSASLRRQKHLKARFCRWQSHDDHLLAAAIDGDEPRLFVTEGALINCAACVYSELHVKIIPLV